MKKREERRAERDEKMKAKVTMVTLALGAAALMIGPAMVKGQTIDSAEALRNRGVLASPRAQEQFPRLRGATPVAKVEVGKTALADIANNRAILASPRALEYFPELRPNARPRAVTGAADDLAEIRANKAVSASPRTLEGVPALVRGTAAEVVCGCDVAVVK